MMHKIFGGEGGRIPQWMQAAAWGWVSTGSDLRGMSTIITPTATIYLISSIAYAPQRTKASISLPWTYI
jgi:hypothetical protein